MKDSKKPFWQYLKEYLGMTVASIINALCMYVFVNPTKLVAGGLTGVASVVCYVIAFFVEGITVDSLMSIMYFVFNIPVSIVSLILLRGDFTIKSTYSIVVSTVALAVLPVIAPTLQFNQSPIIAVIFGGMTLGVAMYFAMLQGASNGGTEVIGKMIAVKRPELDLSRIITVINFVITVIGGIVIVVIEDESLWLVVYSLLFVVVAGSFMGILQRGFDHPQKYMIITSAYEQISDDITKQFKRGFSIVDVGEQKDGVQRKMIMVIVQYRQAPRLKQLIRQHDPNAFTFVKDVHDVFSRPTFNRSYKNK